MDLFLFYIRQIFGTFSVPAPADICFDDSIRSYCLSVISFLDIFVVASLILIGAVGLRYRNNLLVLFKKLLLLVAGIASIFFFADNALRQISEPMKFGIEWFVVGFNLWCFIVVNLFVYGLVFGERKKLAMLTFYFLTIIFTAFFAFTGRGNIEQITLLAGGLFGKVTWKFLWLSQSFRVFATIAGIAFVIGFFKLLAEWVRSGKAVFKLLVRDIVFCVVLMPAMLLPVASIFVGENLDKKDVGEAKDYIDGIKKQATRYYYENGEYPKFIEDMLPAGGSPRLLARHEFFSGGVRGTYYFSRKEKFCFIFQNPVRKFGYYSMTSDRDWKFVPETGEFDDVFINMCDEANTTFEGLISNHLGVSKGDDFVDKAKTLSGEIYVPAQNKAATGALEQKLNDASKIDPSIVNHFNDAFPAPSDKPMGPRK